ncbi:TPA: hypothetical protein GX533_03195 [Candidatus Dojkabacteria bacterium]|uniref:Thymidylate kinase-like domain-containing protein n=1 Tax=Candidatus Dojkabacteria bacterium TaxID=2099670 RepID=A0A832R975_9BACT|nr:hypothetical protein [Candidatus Dojkabacteria bacterium]
MEIKSYGSVCIEGGDQLGKGDATSRIVKELEGRSVNLTFSSFPIYATPMGSVIRSLLKDGISDAKLEGIDTLDVRMALFALNRLEFMDVYLSDKKYQNTMLILDRSPFSNAVSIGYWLSLQKNWDEKEVTGYIDRAMDLESLMISELGLDRCVIQLKSEESEWRDIRKRETDQHEKKEVQEKSSKVYEMYKKTVGSGWHQVVTKRDDGWRDRDDIWSDNKRILKDTYGDMDDIKDGLRYDIGFKEIVENIYPDAEYDMRLYDTYDGAIKENVKEVMYESGLKLSSQVAGSCSSIKFSNGEVKREFRRLVGIVPDVVRVYEYFLGREFIGKLKKALV